MDFRRLRGDRGERKGKRKQLKVRGEGVGGGGVNINAEEEWGIKQDSEWQCSSDWLDKGCKVVRGLSRYEMKVISEGYVG